MTARSATQVARAQASQHWHAPRPAPSLTNEGCRRGPRRPSPSRGSRPAGSGAGWRQLARLPRPLTALLVAAAPPQPARTSPRGGGPAAAAAAVGAGHPTPAAALRVPCPPRLRCPPPHLPRPHRLSRGAPPAPAGRPRAPQLPSQGRRGACQCAEERRARLQQTRRGGMGARAVQCVPGAHQAAAERTPLPPRQAAPRRRRRPVLQPQPRLGQLQQRGPRRGAGRPRPAAL